MTTKIYFCDLCNESIPQEDLEKNRVTSVRGKMICAKCVPPAGAAAAATGSAVAPAAGGGGGLMLVGLLALIVGGAGLFLAWEAKTRLDAAPDLVDLKVRIDDVARTCDRLLDEASTSSKRLSTFDDSIKRLEGEPGSLRAALDEQLHRIENQERSMQQMNTLLGSLRSDRESVHEIELMQSRFEHDMAEMKGALQAMNTRIAALDALPAAPAGGDGGAAAPKDDLPAFDADTRKLIADLTNKDPSARWSAVDRLAKKNDVKLVPHLLPLLDDSDAFVQFRVISTLSELNARIAVGRLIKLLRDSDAIVREQAIDALVKLTGNPYRPPEFANGTPAEREKVVKTWEDWYSKNKERFEEASASS